MTERLRPRRCPVCGTPLEGRRAHARTCSGACRAEASRLRRLLGGVSVDGRQSVAEHRERARNRTEAVDAPRAGV